MAGVAFVHQCQRNGRPKAKIIVGERPRMIGQFYSIRRRQEQSPYVLTHTGQTTHSQLNARLFVDLSLGVPDHHMRRNEARAQWSGRVGHMVESAAWWVVEIIAGDRKFLNFWGGRSAW